DLRQRKPEAAAQLEKEIDELVGVDRALRELEDRLGVPRNTFGHLELETKGDKTLTVIYNRDRVRALIHKHGSDLHRLLKADPTNPDKLMQSLAKREAGVDILQHPDTQSGILYAYFKNAHQRDLMLSGRLVEDAATGRNYRVYDDRVKAQFLQTARRTGVEQVPDGQIVDVDTARPDVELRDFIEHPAELNFDGIDPKAPPPIMETPLSGPGDPVPNPKVDWGTGFFADRFMPRMNLYLKWQERSGVRFYDYFSDIEQAREAATNEFAPFRHFLDQRRWRIRNAEDRTNVQLLLEARIAGREQEVAALEKKMSTKLVEQTKLLETAWRKYLKGIGFEDAEIQASFGDIAQLRKVRGDFRAYAGARTALPRMMTFLRQQLQRGNTPLRIDERETDFYSLGVRLSRLLAYEKHVTPVWNDVGKKLEQDSKVVSIPIDVFNNFKEYMYQVMHTPDDVMVATSRTIRGMHRRLDAAMRKVTCGKFGEKYNPSDEESLDVLGVLSSVGYAANLAFNSATAIQQYFALFQTVGPLLGSSATRTGFKAAVRWFRDPKLQEDMARRGVAGKSSFAQPLAMMEEFMESRGALRSTAALAVAKFVQWGSVPLQVGDDFTRVAAYMGRHEQVMKYGRQYRDGKITWQQFREKARLDLLDGKNGPITRAIKEAIDAGDLQAGAHRAADF